MRMIDADALRDNLQALAYDDWNQGVTTSWADAYSEVADMVEEMPTIEERKKGKWEERKVSSEKVIDEWQSARCSVCEKYHTTPYMYYFDSFSFCPNCGARMER